MMWQSGRRLLMAVALALTTIVGTSLASSAGAAPPTAASSSVAVAAPANPMGVRLSREIKLLDPYVTTRADGTLALAAPAAVVRKVDAGDLEILLSGLGTVNQSIQAGNLAATNGHQLVDPRSVGVSVQWNQTKTVYNWWGVQYYFSEYWTLKIEGLANMGAAAGALCALISVALAQPEVAILCGVASAVLWFGAGWLGWADNGGGVVISETWTPFPVGGIWISGQ